MTTDEPLAIASERLLRPAGLDEGALERAFGALMGPGIDFGDLYFQHARRESWSMEDGLVRDGAHSIEQGVGVRAMAGEKTGFAYSDEIDAAALLAASGSARAIARAGMPGRQGGWWLAEAVRFTALTIRSTHSAARPRWTRCAGSTRCCARRTRGSGR